MVLLFDAIYSAEAGYLARPPDYDGVGYLFYAEAPFHLIREGHLRTAIHPLLNNIAPLWVALLSAHFLVLGDGTWQAFAARFWPIALVLVLVYWIVSTRAPRPLAIAAVALTALIPIVSAGVRSSSWEFFSGQANYNDDFGLDDLRPDFLALALVMWSVAILAEHHRELRRSDYVWSAAFVAAAVLVKPSTAPVTLAAWGAALAVTWFWNRGAAGAFGNAALGVAVAVLLLLPWAMFGHGIETTIQYFTEAAVTYRDAYSLKLSLGEALTYYPVRLPAQLGQLEAWPVILGGLFGAWLLFRRRLDRAEWIYAGLVVLFYLAFTSTTNKNPHVGEWFSFAAWVFVLAGAARFATATWPAATVRLAPRILNGVAVYALLVYALGAFAAVDWPFNEQFADRQFVELTSAVAFELKSHVPIDQCFTYAPGPGWPAALELQMLNADGASPLSTLIDVDPSTTTSAYVAAAARCPAVVVYRENITEVAKVFFCPPVRQPYLQALSDWVHGPGGGYTLARSWQLGNLPPIGPHTLGRYEGVTLTVDLFLRSG